MDRRFVENKQIAKAFINAQKEMDNATKDSSNPDFRSKYADLNSVREACIPALNKHDIAVLQPIVQIDGKNYVKTILLHESGETLDSLTEIIFSKSNDAQAQGSGITYARRYGLQSLVCIGAEDDDGNNASNKTGITRSLAEGADNDLRDAREAQTLVKLKEALQGMGSASEIDGYLEYKHNGKTRFEKLNAMREDNRAEALEIIKRVKQELGE